MNNKNITVMSMEELKDYEKDYESELKRQLDEAEKELEKYSDDKYTTSYYLAGCRKQELSFIIRDVACEQLKILRGER